MPLSDAKIAGRWRLRLFLSVDLVGSTALKARDEHWLTLFKTFFREFPVNVSAAYRHAEIAELIERTGLPPPSPPSPWKFAGDEILFEATLENHLELPVHLRAFKNAVQEYVKRLPSEKRLGLKATGWTAGFPVTNAEVAIGEGQPERTILRDYLGPSMDLGFRLGRLATKDRFVLSADLAWLLLRALHRLFEERSDRFAVFYGGREVLKGVDEEPYPWFWIDMRDGFGHREEMAQGFDRERIHDEALLRFVQEYLERHPAFERPFIASDPDPDLQTIPPSILERFDRTQSEESRSYTTEIDSAGEISPEPDLRDPDPLDPASSDTAGDAPRTDLFP